MELTTSWKEEGRAEGLEEGCAQGLRWGLGVALESRFGASSGPLVARLDTAQLGTLQALLPQVATASLEELEDLL